MPAPTVVLPEAVVPSKKSAETFLTEFMKSMYFCDKGKLFNKTLTAYLTEHIRQFT